MSNSEQNLPNIDAAERRFNFQKSFSQERGVPLGHTKSLIEDAKFETETNAAFQRYEHRKNSKTTGTPPSPIKENETANEKKINLNDQDDFDEPQMYSVLMQLKNELYLQKVLGQFEKRNLVWSHIESRLSDNQHLDYLIRFKSEPSIKTDLLKVVTKMDNVVFVKVVDEIPARYSQPWFPKRASDLDYCQHLVVKFEPEIDNGHPGYGDNEYAERRKMFSQIAFNYRHGQPIPHITYTENETSTWRHVYAQLNEKLPGKACRQHLNKLQLLQRNKILTAEEIPQLDNVSRFLQQQSGFTLRPAGGLLTARDFLASLAFRVFQSTQYVRHWSKPFHSPEPDVIHELLGHVPLLCDQQFAAFSQMLGLASLGASDRDIEKFATLYWYTVEFGLCLEEPKTGEQQQNNSSDKLLKITNNGEKNVKVMGAGLLSAYGELEHALSATPERRMVDPKETCVQIYDDSNYQNLYYVAESFDKLQQQLRDYALTIQKPFEVHYDPFTQTVRKLATVEQVDKLIEQQQQQVAHLNGLRKKLAAKFN